MQQLQEKIVQWAHDRNIIEGSSLENQALKLVEEMGELASGIAKQNDALIKDSIGDMAVVLTIIEAIKFRKQGSPIEFTNHTNTHPLVQRTRENCLDLLFNKTAYLYSDCAHDTRRELTIKGVWSALESVALWLGFSVTECTQLAYDEIKDRKGKLVDGVFVKEA